MVLVLLTYTAQPIRSALNVTLFVIVDYTPIQSSNIIVMKNGMGFPFLKHVVSSSFSLEKFDCLFVAADREK